MVDGVKEETKYFRESNEVIWIQTHHKGLTLPNELEFKANIPSVLIISFIVETHIDN